ncbi:MAG: T9SS type A sorting domain-containing protein, partial [Bacteroidota bacterium]
YLKVESEEPIEEIIVYGLDGTKIKSLNPTAKTFTINLSQLNKGLYNLSIKNRLGQPKIIRVLKI